MEYYTDRIEYDSSIRTESPFPEWIETDRLKMVRYCEDNISPQEVKNKREKNPERHKYFTVDTEENLESTYGSILRMYEYADELWKDGTDAFYAIFTKDKTSNNVNDFFGTEDEFIGVATLEDVYLDRKRAHIGIWLDKDYRGKDLSQERAEALMHVAFDSLDLEVVGIEVVTENKPSIKCVEKYVKKFGGSFEGVIRNGSRIPSGEIKDIYNWSVSKDEFYDSESSYEDLKIE